MSNDIDKETEAIRVLVRALEPLDQKARRSVLDYVIRRLEIPMSTTRPLTQTLKAVLVPGEPPGRAPDTSGPIHIKDLVQEKHPRSAIEMAALIAYYLSHRAPEAERKTTITAKDVETYFNVAGFPLPTLPEYTLPNTKAAGYLDAAGEGEYKLNPAGYDLVVHNLPQKGAIGAGIRKMLSRLTSWKSGYYRGRTVTRDKGL